MQEQNITTQGATNTSNVSPTRNATRSSLSSPAMLWLKSLDTWLTLMWLSWNTLGGAELWETFLPLVECELPATDLRSPSITSVLVRACMNNRNHRHHHCSLLNYFIYTSHLVIVVATIASVTLTCNLAKLGDRWQARSPWINFLRIQSLNLSF